MILSQAVAPQSTLLAEQEIVAALRKGLAGRFTRLKVLVLIPDHTRTLPLPGLFRNVVDLLADAKQIDFMVALGTHPPLDEPALERLVGITSEERVTSFKHIGLINHEWGNPDALVTLGSFGRDEIMRMAGVNWHSSLPENVEIRINKAALEYDVILVLGPVFPHEVVGFSGGAKYLFPGISGPGMINATHWLGALAGVVGTIGRKETPVREMIHAAVKRLTTPVLLSALVVEDHDLAGIFIGDLYEAWNLAAELSAQRNVVWCDYPYQKVLSCAPPMYDELWTAAKAMYKLEPAVAQGGEVIIFAPHLDEVSRVHGRYIYEVGYHILPYFLANWERFQNIPLGVLAHSTHMRGSGHMEDGIEKPNVRVTLASKLSREDCSRLNLGYLDPARVDVEQWKRDTSRESLYVPKAGEKLYRIKPAPDG